MVLIVCSSLLGPHRWEACSGCPLVPDKRSSAGLGEERNPVGAVEEGISARNKGACDRVRKILGEPAA
ncbi:hypothetical protein FCK90_10500 [Kocuria coralli]|uniref:Uncharacterized protein n=1 Tax=Kocuria coralli TaxID=1461025 RepID=A0A5J5KW53_9MICC|nr:hypothetical protein FCK90_10500 [Kocuria coralli]